MSAVLCPYCGYVTTLGPVPKEKVKCWKCEKEFETRKAEEASKAAIELSDTELFGGDLP